MTEEEVRHVEAMLRLCGMPGVAAPVDPDIHDGEWRIYDGPDVETRADITEASMRALYADARSQSTPRTESSAVRGFVIPGA
jgi:hypothetical protein